jgi:hypothetical protein
MSQDNSKPAKQKPLWRSAVDLVDTLITPAANGLVRTDTFADVVSTMTRLEVRMRRLVERQMTSLWHAYSLPSSTDTRRIQSQLAALEARLRDLGERFDDMEQHLRERERDSEDARAR